MTDSLLSAAPSRRRFLLGAGAAVAGAGILALAGERSALAYTLQGGWRWCQLCSEPYSAFAGSGDCPAQAANGHAGGSWVYSMIYNQATTSGRPGYQAGWRWCEYCYALYWPGTNGYGQCVYGRRANDPHVPGASFDYAMAIGFSGPAYQGGWSPCSSCSCLYHSNSGSGTRAGFCWVTQTTHTPNGNWPYDLIH